MVQKRRNSVEDHPHSGCPSTSRTDENVEKIREKINDDNGPAHTALSVTRYLASLGWTVIPHPPYSPDLAPCDLFLFPKMKKTLKGKRFATVEEVKTASQEATTSSFSSSTHSGKKDWTSVLPPMESILKGIKCFLFEM